MKDQDMGTRIDLVVDDEESIRLLYSLLGEE
jgi:hypothetical protein